MPAELGDAVQWQMQGMGNRTETKGRAASLSVQTVSEINKESKRHKDVSLAIQAGVRGVRVVGDWMYCQYLVRQKREQYETRYGKVPFKDCPDADQGDLPRRSRHDPATSRQLVGGFGRTG